MSPEKRYLKWRRQPAVGCVFARLTANNPARYEQRVYRVPGDDPQKIAAGIEAIVGPAIVDPKTSAVVLIFPDLRSLEAVARAMLALNAIPGWKVMRSKLVRPPSMQAIAFNIVRDIPFGRRSLPSEALVFGPFAPFPPTRKAPVTAMEIFVGKPRPKGPLDDVPVKKANLAHMALNLANHAMFIRMWNNSHVGRTRSLNGRKDNRAKAKVSLVIPSVMAWKLGCAP